MKKKKKKTENSNVTKRFKAEDISKEKTVRNSEKNVGNRPRTIATPPSGAWRCCLAAHLARTFHFLSLSFFSRLPTLLVQHLDVASSPSSFPFHEEIQRKLGDSFPKRSVVSRTSPHSFQFNRNDAYSVLLRWLCERNKTSAICSMLRKLRRISYEAVDRAASFTISLHFHFIRMEGGSLERGTFPAKGFQMIICEPSYHRTIKITVETAK